MIQSTLFPLLRRLFPPSIPSRTTVPPIHNILLRPPFLLSTSFLLFSNPHNAHIMCDEFGHVLKSPGHYNRATQGGVAKKFRTSKRAKIRDRVPGWFVCKILAVNYRSSNWAALAGASAPPWTSPSGISLVHQGLYDPTLDATRWSNLWPCC